MSELTEGLDRICRRFEVYEPHRIRALGQGLSLEVIEERVQDLPFKLPSEVYELYEWHDGLEDWSFLFENYHFLSLKRSVYEYQSELKQIQCDFPEVANLFQYRFPIFQNWADCGVFLTVFPDNKGENSIHGHDIRFKDYSLRYHRLTDLILHSAEWYESAKFDEYDGWDIDDEIAYQLDVKYMARERIVELVSRNKGQGLQGSVYQRFLNESNESF
jgi:hypothetical protein